MKEKNSNIKMNDNDKINNKKLVNNVGIQEMKTVCKR